MKPDIRVYLYDDDGTKFFGEGPCRLLHAIDETGSLRQAAFQMEMGYTKAIGMIHRAERVLGFPLTEKVIGGKGGGGSVLTKEAREFLEKYESYRETCIRQSNQAYQEIFAKKKIGCVIMASGLGKRFGSNKLLADFCGKPMIEWVLEATNDFPARVVVTRHPEVEALCKAKGIDVILHEFPGRNDTVRLGLTHLNEKYDLEGCMFCPSDQPLLTAGTLKQMAEAFEEQLESPGNPQEACKKPKETIWRLGYQEEVGTPAIFSKEYFEELNILPEKKGGGYLLKKYADRVKIYQADSERELMDIDTVEDQMRLEQMIL